MSMIKFKWTLVFFIITSFVFVEILWMDRRYISYVALFRIHFNFTMQVQNLSEHGAHHIGRLIEVGKRKEIRDRLSNHTPRNHTTMTIESRDNAESLKLCPEMPPDLKGWILVYFRFHQPTMNEIEKENPSLLLGGYFKPLNCEARWKVAILVPFRNREKHLEHFLYYMHPILQRQKLEYRIYIIIQEKRGKFNRGKLLNIGFVESLKDLEFDCFVLHDVDLILENDRLMYSCPKTPRHLAHLRSSTNYVLKYPNYFGGVSQLTKRQFEKINGFSNSYWGWGGEDDDLYLRILIRGMNITRGSARIARYRHAPHGRDKGNEKNLRRRKLLRLTRFAIDKDGLNSLHYRLISKSVTLLYTNVTVDIFAP